MTDSKDSRQYVTFSLAEELFAVEVGRTREILDLVAITKVPQMPDYLLGVINLRGQVVPVIDLRCKLGMVEAERTKDSCIIVLEICSGGEMVIAGALADQVREVVELDAGQIEAAPRMGVKLRTEFIRGIGKINEQFMILLNIDSLFAGDDSLLAGESQGELAEAVGS